MNKLSKDKRDKLLLTIIGIVGVLSVLYFLVITDQKEEIAQLKSKITALSSKVNTAERLSKRGQEVEANFELQKKILTQKQIEMPRPGQDHAWFLNLMEDRRRKYELEVDDIKTPEAIESGILPKFPFRAVALNVTMVGTYYDFGRFLADFENSYPYMRVQSLKIVPEIRAASSRPGADANDSGGKLRFSYKVIALIKTQI
jgi:Tfp pilus assembly protein PilO